MKLLNQFLLQFNSCFSRTSSFHWFITIIIDLMIRSDKLGITSIIRDLNLDEKHYTNLIHFFHSDAWDLEKLTNTWVKLVYKYAPLVRENKAVILIGDGVKQSKEARRMPGVKKLHQDSENSAKAEYFHGHMFGGTGILVGKPSKLFCVPLTLSIQDGLKPIEAWDEQENHSKTHVVEMIHQAHKVIRFPL